MKDPCMSVNRVAWSPNGSFFGKFKVIQENSFRNNMQCLRYYFDLITYF